MRRPLLPFRWKDAPGGHMAQVRGQSIVYVAKKQYLCIVFRKGHEASSFALRSHPVRHRNMIKN